jgi:hypothetical protein
MATSLIKKAFLPLDTAVPIPVMNDTLLNHEEIECPHCPQRFIFGHTGEEHRLKGWLAMARVVVSRDHEDGHRLMALALHGVPPNSSFS